MRWILLTILVSFPATAPARNLEGRVGAGAMVPGLDGIGALSLIYHPSGLFDVQGFAGFDTSGGVNGTVLGAQVHRNAYLEENMNLFFGLGAMVLADQGGGPSVTTGMELDGLLGAEFFFSGLPNLGFQFQTGLGVRFLRGTSFRTLGTGLSTIGIHYYF